LNCLDSRVFSSRYENQSNAIENLTDQLKNIFINGISRKKADGWRRRWFRVYAYRGQLYVKKSRFSKKTKFSFSID
jgi:hypothetical protein